MSCPECGNKLCWGAICALFLCFQWIYVDCRRFVGEKLGSAL